MIVGVELDGLSEELDGFWVFVGFEGFVPFVFEFDGLLFAHKLDSYSGTLLRSKSTAYVLVHSLLIINKYIINH